MQNWGVSLNHSVLNHRFLFTCLNRLWWR